MAGLPGLGRGRGKRPDPNAKLKPNTVKGGITSSDLLGFFNLEPPSRTFTVPQTATGGMGYVKYAEVDVSERKRREKDKDYAKYYQDQEFKDMTQSMGSLNSSEQTETDVNVTQSDVAKGSNLTSNTQASQMDDIEDLTTIGDLPSFKDLSQEQFTDIYKRYSSCFKDGRHNADLTVSRFKDEIIKTVNMRDTVIIYSPTGTGKTTQVPQYILGHHFKTNRPCKIVVTQPRRIAATSVARRVAKEMRVTLGTLVGYQIGMEKESSPDTCITYMTTGVLLQKLIAQKNMNDFTHVIIDEIHERDQDTDFLMLVVRKYLRFNSRNTKVILMSATIDTTIYSKYFAKPFRDGVIEARVLQLEGKPNDVPEFYLDSLSNLGDLPVLDINEPKVAPECYFLTHQLIKSFDTLEKNQENSFLTANDSNSESRGTVLVFLPGYEHIVAMKKQLMLEEKKWWILPLHSSVTVDEQRRVFEPPQPGFRKIILSTNIAESSITVTDIKYVIDFCLTKCLCRDRETNYVHLKLEWAAKANCDQRKGRAGRVSAGRVYRLVPEPLFNQFRQFILPEMKRCPLELVILKAKKLEMGEPKAVLALALDHPEIIDIEKSVLTLKEVGALGLTCNGSYTPYDGDLTFIGHVMAALPIDAKISKFILLGHVFGCLEDCIIIGACLSVMNIFSKPFAKRLESYKAKLAWANNTFSDCFTLWEAYTTWTKMRERNFFKGTGVQTEADWARQNFLELNRLYEVQNLIEEIKKRLIPLGIKHNYRVEHPQAEFLTSKESKKDKLYVLSVCLCGAFYPNYFLQGETEQQLVYRELSKKNPLDTVYLSGLPSDEGILYEQQIIKLFEGCSDHIRVDFESSKAFVQFSSPNLVHNASSGIARAVYLAVKMRKENIPLEITLLNPAVADKRMEMIESKKKELFTSQGILNSSMMRSSLEYHGAKIPKISLPTMNQSVVKIIIPCIVNCGNFFAQYYHEENQQQISLLENTIRIMSLTPLSDAPRVGNLVLAPYVEKQNDGKMEEKYYRAFVQSVCTSGNSVEVFFLDYGNTDNVLSKKLKEFDYDEEALLTTPTQAVQFRLSSVKPAFDLNTKPGEWSESANKFFKERTKNRTLIARIYSVVERCVNAELYRTELDGKEISINDELVAHGYAEFCEEDYLSKENHDLRKVYEEMSYAHQEKFLKQYGANQDNFITIKMIENRDSNDIYSYKKLKLRGPFSPLESTFYGISQVSRHKKVLIERDSVNCVTLDSEPHDPLTRMMVASYVSMNSRGNIMNARNTTLMPSIQGLPALMILTFAPAMELRRNAQKNKYTGAICGLGFDRVTKKSYYPDHDSEIEANQWLASQPSWDVKTCESVEFKTWGEMVNTEKMTYYERAEYPTWYIRGLRLWLVPNTNPNRPAQSLGYANLVPEVLPGTGGLFGMPQFESLNDLLQRYNQSVGSNPLPGRVLTVESQEMKIPNFSSFDPDRSFWSEHGDHAKHFVYIIRIFFEITTEPLMEKIGVADFVPVAISEGGFFTMPQFEPFCNVVSRASQWCAQQNSLRFCNAQSVEVKMKSGYVVDTQRMSYTEHGGRTTCYVRILRVSYVKTNESLDSNGYGIGNPQDAPPLQLNCKTFVPLQLTRGFFIPEFETLSKTKERIEAWIKATGARVLSCETTAMRLYTGGEAYQGAESSFTYNMSNRNEYWIFVIRLFLNGFYHEPPAEMLPAEPVVQPQDCCAIV